MHDADDALDAAGWRGLAKEAFGDPACTRPEVVSAAIFGAELARTLHATLTDRYRTGPNPSTKRQFATATGATIDIDFGAAQVVVAGADYQCDVTMLPDRIALSYSGDYGPEAITALYLLDLLHEQGELPTDQNTLSGAQLAMLSDFHRGSTDDESAPCG